MKKSLKQQPSEKKKKENSKSNDINEIPLNTTEKKYFNIHLSI